MRAVNVLRALGPIDLQSVRRDSLLRWMLVMPLLIGLIVRFGTPPVGDWLRARFGIEIEPYYPLLASFLGMITPMLYGTVIGFLLLDQKDDRTLTALQVTPLSSAHYLVYRLATPAALSVVVTLAVFAISGVATVSLPSQLLVALGAAPLTPAFALFLAALARNKVQGFALMKAAGVLNWPPVIAWFVRSDWQWAFAVCPTYWQAKLYWHLAADGRAGLWIFAGGVLYLGLLIFWLLRRFERVMHS